MKKVFRSFLYYVFSLWLTSQIIPGLRLHDAWPGILIAGFVLSLLMLVVKPVLKIIFIPINIITFGLISWFVNVIVIYLLTVLVPEVEIIPWVSYGIDYSGFRIPEIKFTYLMSLITVSLTVTFFGNLLENLSES